MKPHRPFELQEYDPQWKKRFFDALEKIKPIFGENLIEINHIGSTSIEGMVAKPQIDILVEVKDLDLVKNCYDSFKKIGFVPRGRGYVNPDDEYVTEDLADGRRLTSVHILQKGNPKIVEYKVFRDFLKENKEERDLYIETKRKLYSANHDNYAEYDGGKKDVILSIRTRAMKWAGV